MFPPPPVMGLGTLGRLQAQVEDRGDLGREALYAAVQDALGEGATRTRRSAGVFSTYQINVPQLDVDVDRVKVKQQNVKLSDVFQTLQVYLGSLYVNDFNRFGRTYQVVAQADAPFRSQVEDILPLQDAQRRRRDGAARLAAHASSETFGPDIVQRYNAYPLRRHQRRRRAGLQLGPGAGRDGEDPRRDAAARHDASSGPISPTSRSSPAARRCSCSRCACCSCSWCSPRSTRA